MTSASRGPWYVYTRGSEPLWRQRAPARPRVAGGSELLHPRGKDNGRERYRLRAVSNADAKLALHVERPLNPRTQSPT